MYIVERHRVTAIHFLRCISQHCYLEHIKEKVALDIFLMTLILNLHCNHLSYYPSFKLSFSLYAYMHPRLFNMCSINASYPFFTIWPLLLFGHNPFWHVLGSKKMHSLSPLPEVSAEKIDFKIVKDYAGGKKPLYPLVVSHGNSCLLAMHVHEYHFLHFKTNW